MSELPGEILAEIFIRVPAEPLFQCRRVCKAWRAVIDDPFFCRLHVLHHRARPQDDDQLIVRGFYKLPLETLANCFGQVPIKPGTQISAKHMPDLENHPRFETDCPSYYILSSDGLDLLADSLSVRFALYNPLTHEFLELPRLPDDTLVAGLVLPSHGYAGLGYDSAADDYKVVRFEHDAKRGFNKLQAWVYSLKLGSWRSMDIRHQPRYTDLVSFNGKIYWLAFNTIEESLVVFDLSTETCDLLPLPRKPPQACLLGNPWQFKVMGGCLFLSHFSQRACLDGWILNSCGDGKCSWTKLFTFSDFVRDGIHVSDLHLEPKAYLKSRDLVLIKIGQDEFIWLDTEKKTSKRFKIDGLMGKQFISRSFFEPSIVRLNGSGHVDGFRVIPATQERKSDLVLSVRVVD